MNLVLSILSAAGILASIIAIVAELLQRPVHESRRPIRIVIAIAFATLSIAVGIASLPTAPASAPAPALASAPAAQGESAVTQLPTITVITQPDKAAMTPPKPSPLRQSQARSEITIGQRERAIPEIAAAADDALTMLRSRSHVIRGSLRGTQSEPDASLQGMITTDLTLDVKLTDAEGVVRDAFTVTSRGGGFTAEASGLQARERLRDALEKRMKEQH